MIFLSLVIPALNEASKIAGDVADVVRYLKEQPYSAELIIVDDGSSDGTGSVAEQSALLYSTPALQIRAMGYRVNRGKGAALRYGIAAAEGEVIAFADSGQCVPLHFLEAGVNALQKGADCAIGSRRLSTSQIVRKPPFYRRCGSLVFWKLMRVLMGVSVSDTQCGFKLYKRAAAKAIFSQVRTDGFMFDIEALLVAKRLRLKVVEFPISWSNDSDSRYHPVWGTLRNLRELIAIRFRRGVGRQKRDATKNGGIPRLDNPLSAEP